MNHANILAALGEALYGSEWITEMARDLRVNRRTVQRWRSGAQPVPSGALEAAAEIALERLGHLGHLAAEARAAAAQAPRGYWQRRKADAFTPASTEQ